jgi:hypothetical protein
MSNKALPGVVLFFAVFALLAGCGSGGSGGSTSSTSSTKPIARSAACKVGEAALPFLTEVPGLWEEGSGPIALACLRDRRFGRGALIGVAVPAVESCVAVYDSRIGEPRGELCEEGSWTDNCEGTLGCVSYFLQEGGFTQFGGSVDAKAKKVEVLLDGKPLKRGVMVARVEGKLASSIGAKEPFVFFAAFIRGCVSPRAVKVELLGAGGSSLGAAQGWDVSVAPCPHGAGQGSA